MSLLGCFHKLMAYVFLFVKHSAPGQPSFDQVRETINDMLDDAAKRADRLGIAEESFKKAEFAVCTWIDEMIIASQWENRFAWVAQLLQRERYGISNAGELFYERMHDLLPDEKNVREVFLACISFGFEGRFFGEEKQKERRSLRLRAIKEVYGAPVKSLPPVLFPEARAPLPKEQRAQRSFDYKKPLIAATAVLGAVIVCGAVYSLILDSSLDTIFNTTLL